MATGILAQEPVEVERERGLRRFSPFELIAFVITGLVLVVALIGMIGQLFGVQVTPHSPDATSYFQTVQAPSLSHPFGTDELGRDVFSRVLYGTHISIEVAFGVVLSAAAIGILIGLIAGYFGGWVDEALMRITDMFFAFPALILAAAIATSLGAGLGTTVIALAVVYWPLYARLVRGQTLAMRNGEMVAAEIALGARTRRVLAVHVLPNLLPIVIIQMSLDLGYVILAIAGLSFLGLGAQPPTPEWGAMLLSSLDYARQAWWLALFPGFALMIAVVGFSLLGDVLRDRLDPEMQ
jgi:peptide/nickel transport system permease protein